MDGGDYRLTLSSQIFEQLHDLESLEAVKPRSWLVKKDTTWVGDQLDTDRSSLSLTSRDGFL
jgi:hypothetical protein